MIEEEKEIRFSFSAFCDFDFSFQGNLLDLWNYFNHEYILIFCLIYYFIITFHKNLSHYIHIRILTKIKIIIF